MLLGEVLSVLVSTSPIPYVVATVKRTFVRYDSLVLLSVMSRTALLLGISFGAERAMEKWWFKFFTRHHRMVQSMARQSGAHGVDMTVVTSTDINRIKFSEMFGPAGTYMVFCLS